jgi:outer membrane protein OmpA-like peptidoglycan-associated protein
MRFVRVRVKNSRSVVPHVLCILVYSIALHNKCRSCWADAGVGIIGRKNKGLQDMKPNRTKQFMQNELSKFARAASLAAVLALLSACSSMPDWANPVEWYEGAVDAISGGDDTESRVADNAKPPKKNPGVGKEFPKLASVPDRPKAPTAAEKNRMAKSLAADRENARYSDRSIKRQAASLPPPPPPAPTRSNRPASAPRPVAAAPLRTPASLPGTTGVRPAAAVPAPPPTPRDAVSYGTSTLPPPPVSRPPQFAPRPAVPRATVPPGAQVHSLATRPTPSTRSIARIGNPTFGAPPADIALALDAGTPSAPAFGGQLAVPPVAGTAAASPVSGKAAATVRFKAGSSQISSGDRGILRQVVGAYRQRGGAIRVEGHASSRTRNMDMVQHHIVNFNVSLTRANVVARELVRQGVPAQAVFVVALSDSKPVYYEVMPAGDAGNQRVEIYFVN